MTELQRCSYCVLYFEGIDTDVCPKCHGHFLEVVASYPESRENEYHESYETKEDPEEGRLFFI